MLFRRNNPPVPVPTEIGKAVTAALESTGFRFAVDSAGRLLAQHVARQGRRLTATDVEVVRQHKPSILAAFGR